MSVLTSVWRRLIRGLRPGGRSIILTGAALTRLGQKASGGECQLSVFLSGSHFREPEPVDPLAQKPDEPAGVPPRGGQ